MKPAPTMKPARAEMRDLECWGVHGKKPCGSLVTLRCPRCACHRCADCAVLGLKWGERHCPMCLVTDPWAYATPEVAA